MSQLEQEYKQVQADLKKVGDDLRTYAEQSEKELKVHSKLSEETKASVDKLLVSQGELQARLQAAEQLMAKLEKGGGRIITPESMGETFVAAEGYDAWLRRRGRCEGQLYRSGEGCDHQPDRLCWRPDPAAARRNGPPHSAAPLRTRPAGLGRTTSNSIEYVRETGFTNNAAPVSENPQNPKPESDITFELDTDPVATIAHWVRASRQVLSDAPMLASYIDGRLRYGLKLKEEMQLLKGSGVGLNLNGLYTQASIYANPGVVVQAETAIDRLRLALLQVTLAEYDADGIVLSPVDWAAIELTKDKNNNYVFATPTGLAVPGLWGRPVVASKSMDIGDFLTGSFQQGAEGWDREDVSVTVSTEDRDNLVKNMVTILCEERVGLSVFRPEAFVKGDFDGLPAS